MVINDPIADMLMRIRNAGSARKKTTLIPFSDMKLRIANVLLSEGYVEYVAKKTKKGKTSMRVLEVGIAYEANNIPRVKGAERISRPSRRLYAGAKDIREVNQGHGVVILSTPKGVMTGTHARKEHVGGELICKVW
jgi:small subunit ribosomal protein S8